MSTESNEPSRKKISDNIQLFLNLLLIISLLGNYLVGLFEKPGLNGYIEVPYNAPPNDRLVKSNGVFVADIVLDIDSLNSYLKEHLPSDAHKFNAHDSERVAKLHTLTKFISNKTPVYEKLPSCETQIAIVNESNEPIRNISIDLSYFQDINYATGGYYHVGDTLTPFGSRNPNNAFENVLKIKELNPEQYKIITIWSHNVVRDFETSPYINISYENGSDRIYFVYKDISKSSLEYSISYLKYKFPFIGTVVTIMAALGTIYFFFNLVPKIKNLIVDLIAKIKINRGKD